MKALKIYARAWQGVLKYRWPILFLYVANLATTFIVTSPITFYFKSKFERSDVLNQKEGFDVSMVLEFLNNYGSALGPMLYLLIIVIVFSYIFSIYTSSAILYAVVSNNQYIVLRSFWNGGLNYFWRILRLSLYYLITIMIIGFVSYRFSLFMGINILEVHSDWEFIQKLSISAILFVLLAFLVLMVKQYAKLQIAAYNQPFITGAVMKGSGFVFKNLISAGLLSGLNIVLMIVAVFILIQLRNVIPTHLWALTFLIAQVILILKIAARIIHLDSCFKLYLDLEGRQRTD
ncbi:hypothetical protein [Portibacter marinus]|uniref:hypothetical protein n=1 Tax=Portibacter marinus TaxID=2898660 RepID=UPI001F4234E2|nr:hypothetical protein [Portibacter marinus]